MMRSRVWFRGQPVTAAVALILLALSVLAADTKDTSETAADAGPTPASEPDAAPSATSTPVATPPATEPADTPPEAAVPASTEAEGASPTPEPTPAPDAPRRRPAPRPRPYYRPRRTASYRSDSFTERLQLFYHRTHEDYGDWFHIGIRSTTYDFVDDLSRVGQGVENYFVGSIDELQHIEDDSWGNLTLGVYFTRNFGIEYREDEVRARTFTDSEDNHSDGDFFVEGSVLSAVVRLPLDQLLTGCHYLFDLPKYDEGPAYEFLSHFVPYIGINMDNLEGGFDAATWWAHGYGSPAQWRELGSPPSDIRNGHVRELRVSDDIGRYEMYGVSVRLFDGLYVDLNWSAVDVELTVDFYLDGQLRDSGVVPMDYESRSIGIRYFF